VNVFDETKKHFSKLDKKLGSYAGSVLQELVRQKEDFGVFADRLEGLNSVLNRITEKNSLRRKDFPQVNVAFYQIESAFRLKRTQNLAVRLYTMPPQGGEHQIRGDRSISMGELSGASPRHLFPTVSGSPKGFLSMLGPGDEHQMGPPSPGGSNPHSRSYAGLPHLTSPPRSPPGPVYTYSPPTKVNVNTIHEDAPEPVYTSLTTSSSVPVGHHSSSSPPSTSPPPLLGTSPTTMEFFMSSPSPTKKKDPKSSKREKRGSSKPIKITLLQRKDSAKGIEKKSSVSTIDKKEISKSLAEHTAAAASRVSVRENDHYSHQDEKTTNTVESEKDFTAITLPDLLQFILEDAPVTSAFRRNFLSTFTLFATPEDVLEYLRKYLESKENKGVDEEGMKKRTLGVVLFVKRWIEERYDTIKEESTLESLQKLIEKITEHQPGVSSTLDRILSQQKENVPIDKLEKQKEYAFVDLAWDKFDVATLCEGICYEEFLLYQKITVSELNHWNSSKKKEKCPNIQALCNFSNHLATWVSTELVKRPKLSERALLLKKFVNMADLMVEMNNFSSCMSIIGGLNSSPITRLKNTWKEAGKETHDQFERINQLMSFRGSYGTYREYLKGVVPPCVPFLGMSLTDLIFISDGNPNPEDPTLINFTKWEMMAGIIHNVKHFQQFEYSTPKQMKNCLETFSNYKGLNEDQLYEFSTFVEPKEGSDDCLFEKYQEVHDRLQKALNEIEILKDTNFSPRDESGESSQDESNQKIEKDKEEA